MNSLLFDGLRVQPSYQSRHPRPASVYELTEADISKHGQPTILLETETEDGHHRRIRGSGDRRLRRRARPWNSPRPRSGKTGLRHREYRPLPPELPPAALPATHDERLSKSSGTVRNAVRYPATIYHKPAASRRWPASRSLWRRPARVDLRASLNQALTESPLLHSSDGASTKSS